MKFSPEGSQFDPRHPPLEKTALRQFRSLVVWPSRMRKLSWINRIIHGPGLPMAHCEVETRSVSEVKSLPDPRLRFGFRSCRE